MQLHRSSPTVCQHDYAPTRPRNRVEEVHRSISSKHKLRDVSNIVLCCSKNSALVMGPILPIIDSTSPVNL